MKIKLAVLEEDQSYLGRIVSVFNTKYADKLEVYSFTVADVALSVLESSKIDVLLAGTSFGIDAHMLPSRCALAYLVDTPDVDRINGEVAICKFQKADLIYREILNVYSEKAGAVSAHKDGSGNTKVIAFASPAGGTGSSTLAAACAMHFAAQKKKTFYLNLEKLGTPDVFFAADGLFDLSDIIYAIKSKKANLSMKLESCVKQDLGGVYFYSMPKLVLDRLELNTEEQTSLISELASSGNYDYIIVDADFTLSKEELKLFKAADSIVWVSDGAEISNLKTVRAYEALSVMEQNSESPLVSRISLAYNRFNNRTAKTIDPSVFTAVGGVPLNESQDAATLARRISSMDLFDRIG